MRVLLDSNAYSDLMRGDGRIAELARQSDEVLLSAIVIEELVCAQMGSIGIVSKL